jgi:hypothetical protein
VIIASVTASGAVTYFSFVSSLAAQIAGVTTDNVDVTSYTMTIASSASGIPCTGSLSTAEQTQIIAGIKAAIGSTSSSDTIAISSVGECDPVFAPATLSVSFVIGRADGML